MNKIFIAYKLEEDHGVDAMAAFEVEKDAKNYVLTWVEGNCLNDEGEEIEFESFDEYCKWRNKMLGEGLFEQEWYIRELEVIK